MQLGKTRTLAVTTALALALITRPGSAATIVIDEADDDGKGFKDPTPAQPIGGNTAPTRGKQALAALNQAAAIWSEALDISVDIHVAAHFGPLDCTVFGATTPATYIGDVPGGRQGTLYPVALASQLAGSDKAEGQASINLSMNSALGTSDCPGTSGFYLGLDQKSEDQVDLVTAVLHELAHGLGMTTPAQLDTGAFLVGIPDIYSTLLLDTRTDQRWSDMSAAQRAESARAYHKLVWDGPHVTAAQSAIITKGMPELRLGGALAALDPAIAIATFGAALTTTPAAGVLSALGDDAAPGDGCSAGASLTGKVAFVESGGCTEIEKALTVQAQGAVAAILVSARDGFVPTAPTGQSDGGPITIPVVAINQDDATAIRKHLAEGLTAQLWINPDRGIGTSPSGRVYVDAEDPVKPHASVTHWDPMISPRLLMQPTYATTEKLDLTLALMQDLGWPCKAGCASLPDGGVVGPGDAAPGGALDGGPRDTGRRDSGVRDASTDAFTPNTTPPIPGRMLDAGPLPSEGVGGIPWAKKSNGCGCRVEAPEREPSAGIAATLVALSAMIRRRSRRVLADAHRPHRR